MSRDLYSSTMEFADCDQIGNANGCAHIISLASVNFTFEVTQIDFYFGFYLFSTPIIIL